MENETLNGCKRWFGSFIAGLFLLTFAMNQLALAEQTGKSALGTVPANKEIARTLEFAKVHKKFLDAVNDKVAQVRADEVFQQKIAEFPVAKKMAAVVNAVERAKSQGFKIGDLLQAASKQRRDVRAAAAGGSLSGTVQVDGAAPTSSVEVVAFTLNGFFAGASIADGGGAYSIADLPAGDYYVVTHSSFVDEFYDNIPLAGFDNWRDATPVTITEGGAQAGIDFDLVMGATISGHVFEADGTTPIGFRPIDFRLFPADRPGSFEIANVFTDGDGFYSLNVARTGQFKLSAAASGLVPEFWNNQPDFASANALDIPDFDTDLTDIDFSLEQGATTVEGAAIAGTVLGPDEIPMLLSFVFAFAPEDTTIAGFGIVLDFEGAYTVEGLDEGNYIVYANNYTGFLDESFPSVRGEYYDDAPTADLATAVGVAGTDTTFGIDFVLESGGAIAGAITDDAGAALDSVLVIGLKLDIASLEGCFPNCFYFDAIDLSVAFSGSDGSYTLGGLSSGDYWLRTVTLLGPNAGLVIDEYHDNVQGLFDLIDATPVTVVDPDTVSGIDFVLDRGGFISGRLVEATDGTTPVVGAPIVLALDAATGLPPLAIPAFDLSTMEYTIGPLATGSYKLLGVVLPDEETIDPLDPIIYLPQFYDGKSTLEDADEVAVTAPVPTAGIDFNMVRAGSITGRVDLATGVPVGADSLFETSVIAYEATTGVVAGGAETTFAGGYRIFGLPPGSYKVAALPAFPGFAVAYSGGGKTFDDANSAQLVVTSGAAVTADIVLDTGMGIITGNVTNLDGSLPLDGVLLLAYDGTGHVVSAGISGLDGLPGAPANGLSSGASGIAATAGQYVIPGLATGSYFVRTFSLFQIFVLLDQLDDVNVDLGGDLFSIFGLLAGAGDFADGLELQLYADAYYPNSVILPVDGEIDLFSLVFNLLLSDGDPGGLIPFADGVPAAAGQVSVTSPGLAGGIDFRLPNLTDVLTSVDSPDDAAVVPQAFGLSQNYPNPFNPSTLISFDVPETARVTLQVYNMLGQQIRTLHDGVVEAGSHQVQWDGANARGEQVAAGLYFLRMKGDNLVLTRKMLFVK